MKVDFTNLYMRKFTFLFLLIPFVMSAQLDRIKVDMVESEFVKAVPEAKRDYDAESGWVNNTDSVGGLNGEKRWKIYNDTVVEYNFHTQYIQGPSEDFPKVDSTDVHKMRTSAEKVCRSMELVHGKPSLSRSVSFTGSNPMNNPIIYIAEWNTGQGMLRVTISSSVKPVNNINAPRIVSPQTTKYQLTIVVTDRSLHSMLNYSIGQPATVFFLNKEYLREEALFMNYHYYTITDSLTAPNARWKFTFASDSLIEFNYQAYFGMSYGSRNDSIARADAEAKTLALISQGQKSFGLPDSSFNKIKGPYQALPRVNSYDRGWIYALWLEESAFAFCSLTETGGGKHPAATFFVGVTYLSKR